MLAIVTCPNEDMLDEFVDHPKWTELATDASGANFTCFIHLTPTSVLGNPKYIAWMMKLGAAADVSSTSAEMHTTIFSHQHLTAHHC